MHESDRSARLDQLIEVDVEVESESFITVPPRAFEDSGPAEVAVESAGHGAPVEEADTDETMTAPESAAATATDESATAGVATSPHSTAPTHAFGPRPERGPAANRPGPRPHEPADRRPRPRPDQRPPTAPPTVISDDARPDGFVQERSEAPVCTAPQLRRFIKSRSYVPMHELRRRFAIEGEDDDVSPLEVAAGRVFVGLPTFESRLLSDLVRNGEIGYELSLDPESPIVIGVYAMRPISRN
jgi:hypothetical protein